MKFILDNGHSTKQTKTLIKNYLYDQKKLKENSKTQTLISSDLNLERDEQAFLVTCPKSFDPTKMLGKEMQCFRENLYDFSLDLFQTETHLTFIVPVNEAEVENLQLV